MSVQNEAGPSALIQVNVVQVRKVLILLIWQLELSFRQRFWQTFKNNK